MTEGPRDPVPAKPRRLVGRPDRPQGGVTDIETRLTSMEAGQALMRQEMARRSPPIAALDGRMDRVDERLARIERRLDLTDA